MTLTNETVEITEGNNGSFCAVIVDPPAMLDRNITVILHTLMGTAERMLYMKFVLSLLEVILNMKIHSVCCLSACYGSKPVVSVQLM